jgi:Ser/Thr protein kinase RdoA (MazF antagonist)
VADRWDVGSVKSCVLVRSYANDVFRIGATDGDWALKVYRRGWRNTWDARWEAELCTHVARSGVAVAVPRIGWNGEAVQVMPSPEGDRAVLLAPWIEGSKPIPPFSPELYGEFGRAAARFHLATTDFRPTAPGRLLNGDHLIRRPLTKLDPSFRGRREAFERLLKIGHRVADAIDGGTTHLPRGVCHGDLTLDNLHVMPNGEIAFYDFDLAGHGCFAFDFANYHQLVWKDKTAAPKWEAFQLGYGEVRSIGPDEQAAAQLFNVGYQIWDLEHTMHNWTAWTGSWNATEGKIDSMLAEIFESAARLFERLGQP